MTCSPIFHRDENDSFFTDRDEQQAVTLHTCPCCGKTFTPEPDTILVCANDECGAWWVNEGDWASDCAAQMVTA